MPNTILEAKTLFYLKLPLNQLFISGLLSLTTLPLHAQDRQTDLDSCDIYTPIEQVDKPIALSEFTHTPNSINIYSGNLTLQVANFQFCRANHPFSDNEKTIAEYVELEHILLPFANTPIADFPSMDDSSREQLQHAETEDPYYRPSYYQEQLVELYLHAALARYMGEYVAKNDIKAIDYLSKVVDYYQQQQPEWSTMLSYIVGTNLVREDDRVSLNNPITLQHKTETGLDIVSAVLLSKAGHLDSKAMLLFEEYEYWRSPPIPPSKTELEQYLQPILIELKDYAGQGSYVATEKLEKIYTGLIYIDKRYEKEAEYWQSELEEIPQVEIRWN